MKDMNLEDFLQPISQDVSSNECGDYLKYDYVYDQIKELRREDDPQLTQGIWLIEPKKAAWNDVEKVCESVLKTKTKDLQIAAWLLEAKTVIYGLAGMNQGVMLLHALCEKFWDKIWPEIGPNGGMVARVSPFFFLSEKVSDRILGIPLTSPQDGISDVMRLSDWVTARHNLRMKNGTGITIRDFQKSVSTTSLEFLSATDTDVCNVIENLQKLEKFINSKCERDAPSFRNIYENLNEIKQVNGKNLEKTKKRMETAETKRLEKLANELAEKNALNKAEADAENAEEAEENEEGSNGKLEKGKNADNQKNGANNIGVLSAASFEIPDDISLEDMYGILEKIAAFLEKKQPQSPSSILIKIASAIGKKTFQELLEINVKNGVSFMGTISELYKILREEPAQTEEKDASKAGKGNKKAEKEEEEIEYDFPPEADMWK